MLEIERVSASRISENDVVVVWQFKPTIEAIAGYTVEIERTYDSKGDAFVIVGTASATVGYFRDSTVNLLDRWRLAIYRITVSGPGGAITTDTFSAVPPAAPEAREIARHHFILLRHSGVPVFIFKHKTIATTRCSICWDKTSKKATNEKCPECLGTGWPSGFHAPFLTMMDIRPSDERTQPKDMLIQAQTTTAHYINEPPLAARDVIVEIGTGDRWRVGAVKPVEIYRILVRQEIELAGLNRTDIEHAKLKLPRVPGQSLIRPLHTRPIRYVADEDPDDLIEVTVTM